MLQDQTDKMLYHLLKVALVALLLPVDSMVQMEYFQLQLLFPAKTDLVREQVLALATFMEVVVQDMGAMDYH